jgi:hypothetical protein
MLVFRHSSSSLVFVIGRVSAAYRLARARPSSLSCLHLRQSTMTDAGASGTTNTHASYD